ncbi:MAG: efflux RND transporter periplasmic adaptor subunit [Verrucomicrobiae bacterium]|nr:efflux RND transporter periplasmic adaptor subunit [Verrucomicrobiae bacterium]
MNARTAIRPPGFPKLRRPRGPRRAGLAALCAGIALLGVSCSRRTDSGRQTPPMSVSVASPKTADVVVADTFVGEVRAIWHIDVRARVKGYVESVHADEGEQVKAGQLLFVISKQELETELDLARTRVKSAEATLRTESIEFESTRTLAAKAIVAPSELELAQAQLDLAEAAAEEARAQAKAAERRLGWAEVRAPFDGKLGRIFHKAGSMVEEGGILSSLSSTGDIHVYFHVSEAERARLDQLATRGNRVSLTLPDGTPYAHAGQLETQDAEVDRTTGNIGVRARFPDPAGSLRHGTTVTVTVSSGLEHALVIPQKSTFEVQHRLCVFRLDQNNVVELAPITPGPRLLNHLVVSQGLGTNDRILLDGILLVRDGQTVSPQVEDWDLPAR